MHADDVNHVLWLGHADGKVSGFALGPTAGAPINSQLIHQWQVRGRPTCCSKHNSVCKPFQQITATQITQQEFCHPVSSHMWGLKLYRMPRLAMLRHLMHAALTVAGGCLVNISCPFLGDSLILSQLMHKVCPSMVKLTGRLACKYKQLDQGSSLSLV